MTVISFSFPKQASEFQSQSFGQAKIVVWKQVEVKREPRFIISASIHCSQIHDARALIHYPKGTTLALAARTCVSARGALLDNPFIPK